MPIIATEEEMESAEVEGLKPLPAGDYNLVLVDEGAYDESKSPENPPLKVTFEVFDGEFKGRKIFETFYNLRNRAPQNEGQIKSRKIGQEFFAALTTAVGLPRSAGCNTANLVGRPFACRLNLEGERTDPKTGKIYPPRNTVGYASSVRPYNPDLAVRRVETQQTPSVPQAPAYAPSVPPVAGPAVPPPPTPQPPTFAPSVPSATGPVVPPPQAPWAGPK